MIPLLVLHVIPFIQKHAMSVYYGGLGTATKSSSKLIFQATIHFVLTGTKK